MKWRRQIFSPYLSLAGVLAAGALLPSVLSAQGGTGLYVGLENGSVAIIDTSHNTVVKTLSDSHITLMDGLALAGTGMYVFSENYVGLIDTSLQTYTQFFPQYKPEGLPAHHPVLAGSKIYALSSGRRWLALFNLSSQTFESPITLDGLPSFTLSSAGTGIYAGITILGSSEDINVVDTVSQSATKIVPIDYRAQSLAAAGTGMYVGYGDSQSKILLLNTQTQARGGEIALSHFPDKAMAVDGTGMYVAGSNGFGIVDTSLNPQQETLTLTVPDSGVISCLAAAGATMYAGDSTNKRVYYISGNSHSINVVSGSSFSSAPSYLALDTPVFSSTQIVDATGDSGQPGTLRYAMNQLSGVGGNIVFASTMSGQTIQLTSPLPTLSGNITVNSSSGPRVIVDGGGRYPAFFARSGTIQISNITVQNVASVGGFGGSSQPGGGGGGGGGGLGAGGGLFVDGANVTLTDVFFHTNLAAGGTGGAGSMDGLNVYRGGGGGGGAFYGASSQGALGGGEVYLELAGGGGGNTPGLRGIVVGSDGQGGSGGGPLGGAGGVVGHLNGNEGGTFGGGGGGGNHGLETPAEAGGAGGFGGEFGGGGAGAGCKDNTLRGGEGGAGGFGGGGGGGGENLSRYVSHGGTGGFGGGGGGGGQVSSVFGGGTAGGAYADDMSGGGGAGLGGAIFIRNAGTLTFKYTQASGTPFSGNTVRAGAAGGAHGSCPGTALSPDLFLSSGGQLTFDIETPMTLASALESDHLATGLPLVIQGAATLTLSGQNTYEGGTHITGHLIVGQDANLGLASTTVTLDSGTLEASSSFSTDRPFVFLGSSPAWPTLHVDQGAVLTLTHDLSGSTSIYVNGPGTLSLAGNNSGLSGTLLIKEGATVRVAGSTTLPGRDTLDLGTIEFTNTATFGSHVITVDSQGGTFLINSGVIATFSNHIDGYGHLTIAGTGEALFTQDTSGYDKLQYVTINEGAKLKIESDILALPANVTDNGQVIFNVTGNASQTIEGTGSVLLSGSVPVTFSGTKSYTGGTTIPASGQLTVSSSTGIPQSGTISNSGALIFTHTTGSAKPGPIQGSGTVQMNGAGGTLVLQDGNSYSGGTLISTGTVQISKASGLGTGPVSLASVLQMQGTSSSTVSHTFTMTGAGAKIIWGGTSWTLSGNISSPADHTPLTLQGGSGALHFSGHNQSTGLTTIQNENGGNAHVYLDNGIFEGDVTVKSGATLEGTGTVHSLRNEGIVDPVLALEVKGDYTQTSAGNLLITLKGSGVCDHVNVAGSAFLDGTLTVVRGGGTYAKNQTYTILTSQNKSGPMGEFAHYNLPSGLNMSVSYIGDPMVVITILNQNVLTGVQVHHHNPQQVFKNLEKIEHTLSSDLYDVLTQMEGMSSDQVTAALDQLHPAAFGAFDLLTLNTNSVLSSIFARHPAENCCFYLPDPCGCPRMSLWVQPLGYFYHQNRIGEQLGFDAQSVGVVGGLHSNFGKGFVAGLGCAYDASDLDWHHHRGNGSVRDVSLALYGDYMQSHLSAEASLMGGWNQFHGNRHIAFSTINRHAKQDHDGYNIAAHVAGGRDVKVAYFDMKPFVSFDYSYLNQEGFKEKGARSLDLHVRDRHSHMLRSEAGVQLSHSYAFGKESCFSPKVWVSGINECFLSKHHYVARFVEENPRFRVRTFNKPIYLIAPGIECSLKMGSHFGISARYGAELNGQITTQKLDGRVEWLF